MEPAIIDFGYCEKLETIESTSANPGLAHETESGCIPLGVKEDLRLVKCEGGRLDRACN